MKYHKNDPTTIQAMFSAIAKDYDRGNAILSLGLHKRWNRTLIDMINANGGTLLDLCCGTGDIGLSFLRHYTERQRLIMLDFCPEMLVESRQKAQRWAVDHHDITYLEADAQNIPLPDRSVDNVTIAYGIRNVRNPKMCAEEVYRVLQPGGAFAILELTRPESRFLSVSHSFYLRAVIPTIGRWITSNTNAYRYLSSSIRSFITAEQLEEILKQTGFIRISKKKLLGGIATAIIGYTNRE